MEGSGGPGDRAAAGEPPDEKVDDAEAEGRAEGVDDRQLVPRISGKDADYVEQAAEQRHNGVEEIA